MEKLNIYIVNIVYYFTLNTITSNL